MDVVNLVCKSDFTFWDGNIVLVIGMLAILFVLVLLMGIFYLMPYISKIQLRGRADNDGQEGQAAQSSDLNGIEDTLQGDGEDEEIVAAITAAITYTRESENVRAPFVIKKIKPN